MLFGGRRRIVDNREASTADVHEEEVESRYEATSGVLIVIGLQATLAGVSLGNGWTLIGLPGWVWLIAVVPRRRCCWCSPGLYLGIVSSRWDVVERWPLRSSA
jgi:hypothetical protein